MPDRIFVGGGVLKDNDMSCPACVWRRGPHAPWCLKPKHPPSFLGMPVAVGPGLPTGTVEFRDREGKVIGEIVNIGTADVEP